MTPSTVRRRKSVRPMSVITVPPHTDPRGDPVAYGYLVQVHVAWLRERGVRGLYADPSSTKLPVEQLHR